MSERHVVMFSSGAGSWAADTNDDEPCTHAGHCEHCTGDCCCCAFACQAADEWGDDR